jgi:mannose-1-phosphate guanylyltransferase
VRAIILAAGRGTRLKPLTYGIPKPLLPVKGRPIIDWVIRNILTHKDIDEILIGISGTVGDDLHERILSHTHGICIDNYIKNMNYRCHVRTVLTPQRETAGDLLHILDYSGIKEGPVLVAYGDNLTSFDMNQMVSYHKMCKEKLGVSGTVLLFEVPKSEVSRFGIAKIKSVDGFNLIENFVEKPNPEDASSRYANAGYYILEVDEVMDLFPRERKKVEDSIFPELARRGKLAACIVKLPFWIDIGTMQAYEEANQLAHESLIIPPPMPEIEEKE